ncbi:MAG: undecaprenyl/decaprenyl-phosphate alpha-N-acetylglucosaminyl 1-phosphate transferase [Phycisphaerales bacterium]|nr:MAG: undecaprenyl/decaprenyl-phosphate alpha-N-acetylglucosaminyl 1-phosphate transferase [Phycisphaerales bacterium]
MNRSIHMTTYSAVYLGSAFLALIVTPAVIKLAQRIDAVDRPGVRTIHERPVPRIGGVAIFVSAVAVLVAVLFLDNGFAEAFRGNRLQVTTLLGAAASIFAVGLIDDLKRLPARVKFLTQLLAVVALCLAGVRITDIAVTSSLVVPLGGWGCLFTFLWVVGITNAVNLSDGLDGLAAGISAIACAVIAVLAIHNGAVVMAVFALAVVGSLSGFLVFNFNPAKIFMGDCGSQFLGFVIAGSSVMCITKSSAIVGLALPALALGVPILDTLCSMLRRFLERRSLFAADRRHFHHRLMDLGLHQRHVVVTIYLVTLVITGLGLFMLVSRDRAAVVIFACTLLLLLLLFRVVGVVRLRETMKRLQERYSVNRICKQERQVFEQLQLQFRRVANNDQWWQAACEAAQRMDFAYLSLQTIYDKGRDETEVWRAPSVKTNMSRLIKMTIPFGNGGAGVRQEFEIAIWANGSIEAASRRATLFGRLLDEADVAGSSQRLATNSQRSGMCHIGELNG